MYACAAFFWASSQVSRHQRCLVLSRATDTLALSKKRWFAQNSRKVFRFSNIGEVRNQIKKPLQIFGKQCSTMNSYFSRSDRSCSNSHIVLWYTVIFSRPVYVDVRQSVSERNINLKDKNPYPNTWSKFSSPHSFLILLPLPKTCKTHITFTSLHENRLLNWNENFHSTAYTGNTFNTKLFQVVSISSMNGWKNSKWGFFFPVWFSFHNTLFFVAHITTIFFRCINLRTG